MRYAVFLSVGGEAERTVRRIWRELAERGINDLLQRIDVPPHIGLAVYEDVDTPPLIVAIERFVAQTSALEVSFPAVGVFPGETDVLFIQPKATPELLELHAAYHRLTAGLAQCHPHYLPENWIPHCTLGMPLSVSELGRAMSEIDGLGKTWKPVPAELRQVSLIEYPEDLAGSPRVETLFSGSLRA